MTEFEILEPSYQTTFEQQQQNEVINAHSAAINALESSEATGDDPMVVNILDTGAIPDNASVDNIGAIGNAWLEASSSGRGIVEVPDGVWYVKPSSGNRINVRSNVTMRLSPGATIKIAPTTGDWWRLFGAASTVPVEHIRITGGTFDGSASENTTGVDVGATALGSEQNFISLEYFDDVAIEDMTFLDVCGVQTIYLAGSATADRAAVRRCRFFWSQGPTSASEYDNSAIYISTTSAMWVQDNYGYAPVGDDARGFADIHGPGIVYTGNVTDGFMTTYLTPHPTAAADPDEDQVVATGNTMRNANWGVQVWPFTGTTVRGVLIADNVIHLAQLSHDWAEATGIAVTEQAVTNGNVERLSITDNIVWFETGDTRSTDKFGATVSGHRTAGIGLGAYGSLADVLVSGNIVVNSPAHGIKLGRSGGANSIQSIDLKGNTVINAGRNTSFIGNYRNAIGMFGTLSDVVATDNTLRDSGSPGKVGNNAIFVDGAASLSNVDVYANTIQAVDATFTDSLPSGVNDATPLNDGYWMWVDATGDLRIKSGRKTSDLDGTVVGTQT